MKFRYPLVFLICFIMIASLSYGILQAEGCSAELPALITSAGQNDSFNQVYLYAEKFGVEIEGAERVISQADLKEINTLLVVVGIGEENLSKEYLTLEAEAERIGDLLTGAKSQGKKIIGIYIEDSLTAEDQILLETVGSFSDYFIIKKPENNGELITQLMVEIDMNYILINNAVNTGSELNKILVEPFA